MESRQAAALYPVGRALRQTFDADNHGTLGTDLTGLMLELARIDPDARPLPKAPLSPAVAPLPVAAAEPEERAPWWRAVVGRLLGR